MESMKLWLAVLIMVAAGAAGGYYLGTMHLVIASGALVGGLVVVNRLLGPSPSNEGSWIPLVWIAIAVLTLVPAWLVHLIFRSVH